MKTPLICLFLLMLTACGGESRAPVTPAPVQPKQTMTLDSPSQGRIVITAEPFALTLIGADGAPVLQQVPAATAMPTLVGSANEPSTLGGTLPKAPTLYAPFAFIVGTQQNPQIPAGPWEANILTGGRAGIGFHATAVDSVQELSGKLLLTLSTNDPSGRKIEATIERLTNEWRITAKPVPATGVIAMSDSFQAAPQQPFYGFGGRHNALDQHGQDFLGWIQQQNLGAGYARPGTDSSALSDEHYMFPNGPQAAYYVSPSFTSSRFSFLLNQDELSRWRMASDRDDAWHVDVAAARLDYSIFTGVPMVSLPKLTAVTGRHRVPPLWALGVIIDRSTVAFTQQPDGYLKQVEDDLQKIDSLGIKLSTYRVEGWFELAPEVRQRLLKAFQARNVKVLAYVRSFAAIDGAGTEDPSIFTEVLQQGYAVQNMAGVPYLYPGNFFGLSALIDFTQPAALTWWKNRIKALMDEGVSGFMQDFGEQVMSDMRFADGRSGEVMHNRYPAIYHKATREALDEWQAAHGQQEDVWFFTRGGYSGRDGTPHSESANFAGDGNTDFSVSSGLGAQAPDMLNRGLSGAVGFTTDIGGYFDFVTPATTKELLIRWSQWAVFSPYMRLHGSVNAGTHMPWNYDDETLAEWKRLTDLRYRARGYIAKVFRDANASGLPVARPLWLAFPGDAKAAASTQEWMLGDDLLTAPVVTEGAVTRSLYLPAGCWQHGESGQQFQGARTIEVPAPLRSLPYFTRCGTRPF